MVNDIGDEVIEELFQSLLSTYQIGLETVKSNELVFDFVHCYKCHKINPNWSASCIDWIIR